MFDLPYFTIGCEDTLEENIEEKYLENHIEKVEELTDGKLGKRKLNLK